MRTHSTNRVLSLGMAMLVAFTATLLFPLQATAATYTVSTTEEFVEAMQKGNGTEIRVAADLSVPKIYIRGSDSHWDEKTIDLNGHTLTVVAGEEEAYLSANRGELHLTGSGALNVEGGVSATEGGRVTVTNTSGMKGPVSYGAGSEITVLEDVYMITNTHNPGGQSAVSAFANGSVTVHGNVTGDGDTIEGVYASTNPFYDGPGHVVVGGNVLADGTGVVVIDDSTVSVGGDVTSLNNYGARVSNGASLRVGGNVKGAVYGLYVSGNGNGANVTIGGDVQGSVDGVRAPNVTQGNARTSIFVGGNVTATAEDGVGLRIGQGVEITVEGTITAPEYISLRGKIFGIDDYITPTTKEGYRTYAYRDAVAWVRDIPAVPVTGVSLSDTQLNLFPGDQSRLTATVLPENATNKAVAWRSENTGVATVDDQGRIAAVSEGSTVITATTADGGFTARCEITVSAPDYPVAVPGSLQLEVEDSQDIIVYMGLDDMEAESAVLSGYDGDVVSLSADSVTGEGPHRITVTGQSAGSTTISLGWSGGSLDGQTQDIPVKVSDSSGTPDPEPTPPPTGSGGSGGGSKGSSGGGTTVSDQQRAAKAGAGTAFASGASSNVSADGSVSSTAITAELSSALKTDASTAVVKIRNAKSISPDILKQLARTASAAGKEVVLHGDTMGSDGKTVQGRVYVEPAKLTSLQQELKLGIYTEASKTGACKAFFEKWYSNPVAVVSLEHQGGMGARLQMAALVDLTGMQQDALVFYTYDKAANTITKIENPGYSVDSNGYLHFFTDTGGDIIIASGTLVRK